MRHQQCHTIGRTLIDLSAQDKLELVERLVHELRIGAASTAQPPAPRVTLAEDEFKQKLLSSA